MTTAVDLSVITRTYNRPTLLERAMESVVGSALRSIEWIVVDDSGTVSPATSKVVDHANAAGIRARAITSNRAGRAGAANAGWKAALGRFVHFHDDDDTVEPAFYATVLDSLSRSNRRSAVRVMCRRIDERIEDGVIKPVRKRRHYPERRSVTLLEAAEIFAYPPIGTVFSRSILEQISGFKDDLEIAEDYDLLLRYLLVDDIYTIDELLANFHVRPSADGADANSEITYEFKSSDLDFRNRLLREDINSNRFGLGWLLFLGYQRRQRLTVGDYIRAARFRFFQT